MGTSNKNTRNWKEIVINTLYKRDSGMCQLCLREIDQTHLIEIDHIIQKSEGGQDVIDNLRLVHLACHKARHTQQRAVISASLIKEVRLMRSTDETTQKGFKRNADRQLITALKIAYQQTGKQNKAAKECGMTPNQLRYLKVKYKLPHDIMDWGI